VRLQELSGRDEHSLVGDAMFVDSGRGDYRVKEGSPALELGFENFPMDQFGVVNPEFKRIARTPQPAESVAPAEGQDQRVMQWLGAEVKNVTTPGEVSATGLGRAEGVLIVRVPPNSKAARAGLRNNDVILRLNATAVADGEGLNAAWQAASNRLVNLTLWREQKRQQIELKAAPK
jgi:S1-C subfamily serine protease